MIFGQADRLQAVKRARAPLAARQPAAAAQFQREQDVLQRGQRRDELEELEDDAHVASAPARERVLAAPAQLLPGEDDLPARRAVDAGQQVEQRRLAAAGGAVDGEEALRWDAEGEVVEDDGPLRARGDDARKALDLDDGRAMSVSSGGLFCVGVDSM